MKAATSPIVVGDYKPGHTGAWEQVAARAPQLAATIDAYLVELATTLVPSSVQAAGATLRQFAGYVTAVDAHCQTVASITGHQRRRLLPVARSAP